MDLVILAAGMGSRFGGLKQLEPMDGHGDFIIDYSVFDAIRAGFDKIVFIIRKANAKVFKDTIGSRIPSDIPVEYVFQENDSIPNDKIPSDRKKPLGTGHAILCCKNVVKNPFMIINADDFYGYSSYDLAAGFINDTCSDTVYGCVAYEAGKTITENGSVKRGICNLNGCNITGITESSISKNKKNTLDAKPLSGEPGFEIKQNTPVSMNMFILSPSIFRELEIGFNEFVNEWKDPEKDEYLLPDIISNMVKEKRAELRIVRSPETWYGMTYKEDKQTVIDALKNMRDTGRYPKGLWSE